MAETTARIGAALTALVEAVGRSVERAGVSMADIERLVTQEEAAIGQRQAELEARHERRVQDLRRRWQRY